MQKPLYVTCPYCGSQAEFTTSQEFYGRDYGTNIYVCRPCDAYVGTHKRTNIPKGSLATKELRRWRIAAHNKFDAMWRGKKRSRTDAYRWMQKVMNMTSQEAHIGKFTIYQCQMLIKYVDDWNYERMRARNDNTYR
jgi:zinc-finger-containing domain